MYIGIAETKSFDGNLLPGMIVKGECYCKSVGGNHTYIRDLYKVGDKFDHLRGSKAHYQIKPESLLKVDIGEPIPSSYRDEFKDSLKPISQEEVIHWNTMDDKTLRNKRIIEMNNLLDDKYKEVYDSMLNEIPIRHDNGMWAQFKRETGFGKPRGKFSWVADVIWAFFAVYGFIKFFINLLS